jgi:hypothetical protein
LAALLAVKWCQDTAKTPSLESTAIPLNYYDSANSEKFLKIGLTKYLKLDFFFRIFDVLLMKLLNVA